MISFLSHFVITMSPITRSQQPADQLVRPSHVRPADACPMDVVPTDSRNSFHQHLPSSHSSRKRSCRYLAIKILKPRLQNLQDHMDRIVDTLRLSSSLSDRDVTECNNLLKTLREDESSIRIQIVQLASYNT